MDIFRSSPPPNYGHLGSVLLLNWSFWAQFCRFVVNLVVFKSPPKAMECGWAPPPRTENVHSFVTYFWLKASLSGSDRVHTTPWRLKSKNNNQCWSICPSLFILFNTVVNHTSGYICWMSVPKILRTFQPKQTRKARRCDSYLQI